jgi:hypothetical protein
LYRLPEGSVRCVVLALVALLTGGLVACGQSPSGSPSPSSSAIPEAVSYSDSSAMMAAIGKAFGWTTSPDPSPDSYPYGPPMPPGSHAQRFNLGLNEPGSDVPVFTMGAVFTDARWRRRGEAFGQQLAAGYHVPAIYQLKGPNWLLWGVDRKVLQVVQHAIGGELGLTPLASSPSEAAP